MHPLGWRNVSVGAMCRPALCHQTGVAVCRFEWQQRRAWQAGWDRTRRTPATGCPLEGSGPSPQRPAVQTGPGGSSPGAGKQSPSLPGRGWNRKVDGRRWKSVLGFVDIKEEWHKYVSQFPPLTLMSSSLYSTKLSVVVTSTHSSRPTPALLWLLMITSKNTIFCDSLLKLLSKHNR